MLSEKITTARLALGTLAGNVQEEEWALIKCVQRELDDAAAQAKELEKFPLPQAPEATQATA